MSRLTRVDLNGVLSDRPSLDYLLAGVVVAGHVLIIRQSGSGDFLSWIESDRRSDVYSGSGAVIATLGGLSAIGLAIYQSASGDRSKAIRVLYGNELRRNWRGLLVMAGLSSLLCYLCMALDQEKDPISIRFVFEWAMVFAVVRFVRLVWIFDRILQIADRDLTDAPRRTPAAPSARWRRSNAENRAEITPGNGDNQSLEAQAPGA
ncbi:hypothetical protein GCM10009557_26920 [Virgisporangium ochraceum]|uniref:Uncharacterized protein n=1 Tax=Virgisporangium ochraceum TaxID=65505 RepID=A0A8J3ZQD1_9ACTN|nr:hypothetical protein [Virgisporangium ochraceum]GIJ65631.1 hypothetical protein Voc01_005480 [Virgisporangium ochraceum]